MIHSRYSICALLLVSYLLVRGFDNLLPQAAATIRAIRDQGTQLIVKLAQKRIRRYDVHRGRLLDHALKS